MNKAQFCKAFPFLLTWKNDGSSVVCSLRFETEKSASDYAKRVFKNMDYELECDQDDRDIEHALLMNELEYNK
jgi:hypothetical protein